MPEKETVEPVAAAADCCDAVREEIGSSFDRLMLERTRSGSPPPIHPVSERLLTILASGAVSHPDVLEIGCGGGALLVALLNAGATKGTGFDLSSESIRIARLRAAEAGVAGRVEFAIGDGSSVTLSRHDWVVLDRVLCCFPHPDVLLGNAIPAAGTRIAFSVPVSSGFRGSMAKALWWLKRVTGPLRGRTCGIYVHDLDAIEAQLRVAGFQRTSGTSHWLWRYCVFDRARVAPS